MKKLFLYLLRKYSKTEKGRIEILKELDDGIYYNYFEQTPFGNVYNYFIEFIMANEFVDGRVREDDKKSLDILKGAFSDEFSIALDYIRNEHIKQKKASEKI